MTAAAMEPGSRPAHGRRVVAGRVLSGLVVLALAADAAGKLIAPAAMIANSPPLGLPADPAFYRLLGAILAACTGLYAWPRTAVLGAILVTGYLGGAIATHLRVASPLLGYTLFGVYMGIAAWAGLWLRDPRLRGVLPLRAQRDASLNHLPSRYDAKVPARTRRQIMRVMVFVKATGDSENSVPPTTEAWTAMDRYNEELVEAGVMIAAAGLKPSAEGKRIAFDGPDRTVVDGPFADAGALVAGFWIWEVKDLPEAVDWAKRCPNPMPGRSEIEIRPYYEATDLAEYLTPEELSTPREGERGRLGVA